MTRDLDGIVNARVDTLVAIDQWRAGAKPHTPTPDHLILAALAAGVSVSEVRDASRRRVYRIARDGGVV